MMVLLQFAYCIETGTAESKASRYVSSFVKKDYTRDGKVKFDDIKLPASLTMP